MNFWGENRTEVLHTIFNSDTNIIIIWVFGIFLHDNIYICNSFSKGQFEILQNEKKREIITIKYRFTNCCWEFSVSFFINNNNDVISQMSFSFNLCKKIFNFLK